MKPAQDEEKPKKSWVRNPKGGPGRPKGCTNKATRNAREAIAALVENNVPRMQKWLDQIAVEQGPMAAWNCMRDVIEYHVPKLLRSEHTGPDGSDIPVAMTITHVKPEHPGS